MNENCNSKLTHNTHTEQSHHNEHCHHGYHCSCHHHSHPHCNDCHHNHCLHNHHKKYCDDFRLRLGGLHGGLNFRLRQMIGCEVEFHLENSMVVYGEVCYVGKNFVELQEKRPQNKEVDKAKSKEKNSIFNKDNQQDEPEKDICSKCKKPRSCSKKCDTVIFPIDKIEKIKHHRDESKYCTCIG